MKRKKSPISGVVMIAAALAFLVPLLIPLPGWLIDILIIISFALSITVYLRSATIKDWSNLKTFPTIILLSAVFRISLSVAITKKILTDGEPGKVIGEFGNLVIGSNAIVGFVIFIIIIVVQFIIANGAGRLSEVSARFTLDSLPGKQMSIDADLNAGAISQEEAEKRRNELSQQIDFFGHMDGAGKFVKGDVWLNIIVVFVNIIGGLIVGMMTLNMTFSDSINHFTILTIGDGLVSLICSFLITVGSAIIMTRVYDSGSDSEKTIINNILDELVNNPTVNYIVSGIFAFFAFLGIITELPFLPFIVMSSVFGYVGYVRKQEIKKEKVQEALKHESEKDAEMRKVQTESQLSTEVDPIMVEVGFALIPVVNTEKQGVNIKDKITLMRKNIGKELGVKVPKIRITDNTSLTPKTRYNIKIKDSIVASGEIRLNSVLALKTPFTLKEVEGVQTLDPIFGEEAIWIREEQAQEAKAMNYQVLDPLTIISTHLSEMIKMHIHELLDRQQVYDIVENVGQKHKVLIEEINKPDKGVDLSVIQGVLKNLLREGISIRDMASILESIIDGNKLSDRIDDITMIVRERLSKQICEKNISSDGKMHVLLLPESIEENSETILRHDGYYAKMKAMEEIGFISNVTKHIQRAMMADMNLVILTRRNDLRCAISRLVYRNNLQISVMMQSELVQGMTVEHYGTIEIENTNE